MITNLDDTNGSVPLIDEKKEVALSIVQDLLECLNLPYSSRVLQAESNCKVGKNREDLLKSLNLGNDIEEENIPILYKLLEKAPEKESVEKENYTDDSIHQSDLISLNSFVKDGSVE